MIDLNNIDETKKADPDGYLEILEKTPALCRQMWDKFKASDYEFKEFDKIVVCAMGGSAIGADMARFLIEKHTTLPVQIVRDYNLPNWVDDKTLALVLSYSGNTEETLSGFADAKKNNAQIFVMASGGKLLELAIEGKLNYFELPKSFPPRTTWGLFFYVVLELLMKAGKIKEGTFKLEESIVAMEKIIAGSKADIDVDNNLTKQIAMSLTNSIPIVFGAEHLASVASRWKKEFNENSKIPSFYDEIPELNHNLQQGLECKKELKDSLSMFVLSSELYHERNQRRAQIIQETFSKQEFDVTTIQTGGKTYEESIAGTVVLGTYISVYLAFLLGKNPVLFEAIEELKAMLNTKEFTEKLLQE
ncbi:bifunctional phosphoglucose/phosphomannose isomerase [Patescibacteria group bacterium]|nr:bifunctional phosphoglucose/phosphomannose isomerase [Patescibacteria group bacterium]